MVLALFLPLPHLMTHRRPLLQQKEQQLLEMGSDSPSRSICYEQHLYRRLQAHHHPAVMREVDETAYIP